MRFPERITKVNIFVLDKDPVTAARTQCDKHVVKMIVESGQMLSTTHRVLDGVEYIDRTRNGRRIKRWRLPDNREQFLYKGSFVNHPCTKWTISEQRKLRLAHYTRPRVYVTNTLRDMARHTSHKV